MSDAMMKGRDIRPEDIGPIVEVVGTMRESTSADLRGFVAGMGSFETREDPWKTTMPSDDELQDTDIEVFRRFLAAPDTVEAREIRFQDTAERLGVTPGDLMLWLAAAPLVVEAPTIGVTTK